MWKSGRRLATEVECEEEGTLEGNSRCSYIIRRISSGSRSSGEVGSAIIRCVGIDWSLFEMFCSRNDNRRKNRSRLGKTSFLYQVSHTSSIQVLYSHQYV